jgi:hypothetical protein
MQCQFQVANTTISAAWGCDFRVSRDFRGKGLGTSLEKARIGSVNFFSIDMSKISRLVKIKLGALPGKSVIDFFHIKRLEPSLIFRDSLRHLQIKSPETSLIYRIGIKLGAHKLISAIVTFFFNYHSKIRSTMLAKANSSNLEFKSVDCFDETATQLWKNISKRYSFTVRRDCTYLNWKYVQQPNINYQRYVVLNNSDLCGILIFRLGKEPEMPIGTIAEAFTDQDDGILKKMIDFAFKSLYDQGAMMIRCASTTTTLSKILINFGFRPFKYHAPVFLLKGKNCLLQQGALKGEWFISLGDQDLDEHPRARQPSLKQIIQVISGKIIGHGDLPNKVNYI